MRKSFCRIKTFKKFRIFNRDKYDRKKNRFRQKHKIVFSRRIKTIFQVFTSLKYCNLISVLDPKIAQKKPEYFIELAKMYPNIIELQNM